MKQGSPTTLDTLANARAARLATGQHIGAVGYGPTRSTFSGTAKGGAGRSPRAASPPKQAPGQALADAFQSKKGWSAFKKQVKLSDYSPLTAWVATNDVMVTAQLAQRPKIPPHYGNSSIEQKLSLVKERIDSRA
jgi:hypothetical protein